MGGSAILVRLYTVNERKARQTSEVLWLILGVLIAGSNSV
jgi:hypothetical protein